MTHVTTIPGGIARSTDRAMEYPSDPIQISINPGDMIHLEQGADLVSLTPSQALELGGRLIDIAVPKVKLEKIS